MIKEIIAAGGFLNGESNVIPILSVEDEINLSEEPLPEEVPLLPLRNTVLFPGMVIPITVGREKSLRLARDCANSDEPIGVVAQRDNSVEDPTIKDMYRVGTIARILKTLNIPDGNVMMVVQGVKAFEIGRVVHSRPYYRCTVQPYPNNDLDQEVTGTEEFKAKMIMIRETMGNIMQLTPGAPRDAIAAINNIESNTFLLNFIVSNLSLSVEEKQEILETQDITIRADKVLAHLTHELQVMEIKHQIHTKSHQEMEKQQREYILNQQMKTIQEELGGPSTEKDFDELRERAAKKKWNQETADLFEKEFKKLQRTNYMSPDYSVQLNYLELLLDLPWNEYSEDNFDLKKTREILDKDHYGLEKVKERILEYLAVLKLKGDMKSPILCLAGPPGVGKTSLGRSIAESIGRKYVRISLGGVHDEAEIRGHRKTYIGAMPGRIIQNMRKVGYANPVFVLDEIDKVSGMSVNGDPSAALLEVMDPEQNSTFNDNYLETPFDLSKVLFIATANNLNSIHPALLDRMEIIDIPGYLAEEKLAIATRHLIPKQLTANGLTAEQLTIPEETVKAVISDYTREAGVRGLERTLAKIIRKRAAQLVQDGTMSPDVKPEDLKEILGSPIFQIEKALDKDVFGVATGLAWTAVGGEILFVEALTSAGKGEMTLTGNLGDVMKESATIAYEFLKAHAEDYHIDPEDFNKKKVHIHVPEGATPKDGPSAGITILTALVSAFTQTPVREKVAMTGEITLRGKLLPVGGIKEKILAAKRCGIFDIVMSKENKKDIDDIKENFIDGMTFHYFESMKEAVMFNFKWK
ncbi:MAG: endopeptidase La [Bacteroidales bacterium]|nr:endopeptidase La [Bacteroidales bacterium]